MPSKPEIKPKIVKAMAKEWANMTGEVGKLPNKIHRSTVKAVAKEVGF